MVIIAGERLCFSNVHSWGTGETHRTSWRSVQKDPVKLLQNLVWAIADLRGNFWPDLGPEIVDLRLQSGHLGANCVRL